VRFWRQDGTFSRDDFTYDHVGDVYPCPAGAPCAQAGVSAQIAGRDAVAG
jgi:hypothetical protein